MITKKMVQGMIDLIGAEYHSKLTNKEFEMMCNHIRKLYKKQKVGSVE